MMAMKGLIVLCVLLAIYKSFNKICNPNDEPTGKYSVKELVLSVAQRWKRAGFMGYRLSSSKVRYISFPLTG